MYGRFMGSFGPKILNRWHFVHLVINLFGLDTTQLKVATVQGLWSLHHLKPDYPKFRLLEHHQFKGMDFASQAQYIKKLTTKYNVKYIGLGYHSGMGTGVAQLVLEFFRNLTTFNYSVDVKKQLVMKGNGCDQQRSF